MLEKPRAGCDEISGAEMSGDEVLGSEVLGAMPTLAVGMPQSAKKIVRGRAGRPKPPLRQTLVPSFCMETCARFVAALWISLAAIVGCSRADSAPTAVEQPKRPAQAPAGAGDTWPLFRADAAATGVARGSLPRKLRVLWTFSVDDGWFESTAAIAEGTVYFGSTDGNLYAVDLGDGRKKWAFATKAGFTASPAVRDGFVYIGDSYGTFYCVDAEDGKRKWNVETEAEINSSANFYQDKVLFGSQDGTLYCLKADTGQKVWEYVSDDMIQCSPTVAGDRTFVAGCDAQLHVVDLNSGEAVAKVNIEAPTLCTPAVLGRTVFVGTTGNSLFAIDWQEAKVAWTYQNPERSAEFRSSAAVAEDLVIVGSRDKLVHAVDPESGRRLWAFPTRRNVDSSPVIVGDRVFVGSDDGCLYALDRKTGKEVWKHEVGGSLVASPAVAAGRLVIGTDQGDLYCFGGQ